MSDVPLRAQELQFVEEVRGCNPVYDVMSPEDPAVFYGMDLQPQSTACSRGQPFDESCFYSWSWDLTRCTDMLPFSVHGLATTGVFTQISSLAASRGIQVGSRYMLLFGPLVGDACHYHLTVFSPDSTVPVYQEGGRYNWLRSMRADPNDGTGGANKQATVHFAPTSSHDYASTWIARERFEGSFQSCLGFATFHIHAHQHADNPCMAGGASNPAPTRWGSASSTSMN